MKKISWLALGFALFSLVIAVSVSTVDAANMTTAKAKNTINKVLSGHIGSGEKPKIRFGEKPKIGSGLKLGSGMKIRGTGNKPEGWSGLKLGSGNRPEIGSGTKPLSGEKIKSGTGKQIVGAMEVTEELTNAINWMYAKGLTSFGTVKDFKVDNYLTREQAAKFFAQFAEKIVGKTTSSSTSTFSDLSSADSTLKDYIKKAAKLGILKGTNGKFGPHNKLTRAQAIAIIIRSVDGTLDESGSEWYANYYNKASSYGILDNLNWDESSLNSINIKRGEVALLLYRLTTSGAIN